MSENHADVLMKAEEILSALPHRYPFLLVDRVTKIDDNLDCAGYKCISLNEPWAQGHFPGKPIYPGVLIIESMAQLVGAVGLSKLGDSENRSVLLAGVNKCRFRHQVVAGDRLELRGSFTAVKRNIYFFHCEAFVDGKPCAEADLSVVLDG